MAVRDGKWQCGRLRVTEIEGDRVVSGIGELDEVMQSLNMSGSQQR